MGDSIKKYNELMEKESAKEFEVVDPVCLCDGNTSCTNCAKFKAYLVTHWRNVGDVEEQNLYRFDDKSLDYVKGFVDALDTDPRTNKVYLGEVI